MLRFDEQPRWRYCASPATSAGSSTGATQVSAPASSSTQSSRSRRANAAEKVRPDLALCARRRTDARSTWSHPSALQRLAKNLGSMAPTAMPAPVGSSVVFIAGVAAGEHVVPGPRRRPGCEVFVDREGHQPEHSVCNGDIEVGTFAASTAAHKRAAMIESAACMPPAAASATVAPGSGRTAAFAVAHSSTGSRSRPDSRDRVRPTLTAGRPGRSRSWSSRRSPGCGPPRPRNRCRAGRRPRVGSSRPPRLPSPRARGTLHAPRRPCMSIIDPLVSTRSLCRRRRAVRWAPDPGPGRGPDLHDLRRRSRQGSGCSAPRVRLSTGRARSILRARCD